MTPHKITYRVHAIRRMYERRISDSDVRHVLEHGERIEEYPEDTPYPSALVLGWRGSRPLHVVAAENAVDNEAIVITAYEPEPDQWEDGFRKRKETP